MRILLLLIFLSSSLFAYHCGFDSPTEWKDELKKTYAENFEKYKKFPSVKNALITKEYAKLMNSDNPKIQLIGYFYSEASFHLGRITRFKQWPSGSEYAEDDQKFITGIRLRTLLRISPDLIAAKLMAYSESLFYELYWSLIARDLCGRDYVLNIINNEHLATFHTESDSFRATQAFLRYEQTYLQNTLYQDLWVKPMMKLGTVDSMRWISFPGLIGRINFKSWCQKTGCGSTSYHLENRINFDLYILSREIEVIEKVGFDKRVDQSQSLFINEAYLSAKLK
tara:strand:+ start:346375 stop:347220 length:846 start_codon:yes stop_codon:yes gene_type:complete